MLNSEPFGKSDHVDVVVLWELLFNVSLNNATKCEQNYWKGKYIEINKAIATVNWQEVFQDKSVEALLVDFKQIIDNLKDIHIPEKTEHKIKKNS